MEKYESNERSNDKLDLPRNSPHLFVEMGGRAVELTWYNTLVQLYAKPYQHLSHIEHQHQALYYDSTEPEQEVIRVFSIGDCQNLMAQKFPIRLDHEPADEVAEEYLRRTQARLSKQLDNYGKLETEE